MLFRQLIGLVCFLAVLQLSVADYTCPSTCSANDCKFFKCRIPTIPLMQSSSLVNASTDPEYQLCRNRIHTTLPLPLFPNTGFSSHFTHAPTRIQTAELVDFTAYKPDELCYGFFLGPLSDLGDQSLTSILNLITANLLPIPVEPRLTTHEMSIYTRNPVTSDPDRPIWKSGLYNVQFVRPNRTGFLLTLVEAPSFNWTGSVPVPSLGEHFWVLESTPGQQNNDFFTPELSWFLASYSSGPGVNCSSCKSTWSRGEQNMACLTTSIPCNLDADPWFDMDSYESTTFMFNWNNQNCACDDNLLPVVDSIAKELASLQPYWQYNTNTNSK